MTADTAYIEKSRVTCPACEQITTEVMPADACISPTYARPADRNCAQPRAGACIAPTGVSHAHQCRLPNPGANKPTAVEGRTNCFGSNQLLTLLSGLT